MSTWRFAKVSVRWLLAGWIVAWSMLITEPCCYANGTSLPAGHTRSVLHEGEWDDSRQSPRNHTEHDGCDGVVSGALSTVASDSTPGIGTEGSLLLASPAYVAPVWREHQTVSLPVPQNSTPPPLPLVYLATARLRI